MECLGRLRLASLRSDVSPNVTKRRDRCDCRAPCLPSRSSDSFATAVIARQQSAWQVSSWLPPVQILRAAGVTWAVVPWCVAGFWETQTSNKELRLCGGMIASPQDVVFLSFCGEVSRAKRKQKFGKISRSGYFTIQRANPPCGYQRRGLDRTYTG